VPIIPVVTIMSGFLPSNDVPICALRMRTFLCGKVRTPLLCWHKNARHSRNIFLIVEQRSNMVSSQFGH
jgi:hypothetical protein